MTVFYLGIRAIKTIPTWSKYSIWITHMAWFRCHICRVNTINYSLKGDGSLIKRTHTVVFFTIMLLNERVCLP